ncbi:hypothetical protein [Actinoallomurus rhizosphaericola]|uniref:hypothetical protein n=1 Tax=Actinoallomurus rhizosphaericola TaxID=2952536 RepID=UPI002092D412|nr:hypothetical protein [Actinoallomurus rhizosphaericola]MCO5998639.1 hypothetical protein [Actinoallomurus rhizosphaericola]
MAEQPHLYQFDLGQGDQAAAYVDPSAGLAHPASSAGVAVTVAVTAVGSPMRQMIIKLPACLLPGRLALSLF